MKKCSMGKALAGSMLAIALVMSGCSDVSSDSNDDFEVQSAFEIFRSATSVDASSQSTGSITTNKTYGDFTVLATSAKPVSITKSSTTFNGKSYTKAFDMKGGFDGVLPTYRAIKFTAKKGDVISAIVNANSSRTLQLSNGTKVVASASVSTSTSEFKYTVTADGTYYLYSKASALRIFSITNTAASTSESGTGTGTGTGTGSGSGSTEVVSGSTSYSSTITQSGVGTASRLGQINTSKIANAITVSTASEFTSALTKVAKGGAIVMKAGTYKFSSQVTIANTNNGTASAMKYILPETGAKVILDFSGESYNTKDTSVNDRGLQINGDYWHIYDISVTGAADNGIYVAGNNNIIEKCVLYGNRDTGLQISREKSGLAYAEWPANNLILNCTAYDNADPATGENADGFACKLTAGDGNVFDGCISYCNCDDGWDLYAKSATGSIGVVTIKNSVAFNNGRLTTNGSYANGDMNGFKLGGSNGAVPTAHVVSNCLAFGNGHDGFTDNGNGGALSLTNCTSYNNAKVNFNFYRTNKGTFTGMVTGSPNNSDKYGTSSVASTISKSVYFTNNKYFLIDSAVSITNGQKNYSNVVSAPSFKSTSTPALNSSVHSNYRNSDGTVKMGDLFVVTDSKLTGAKFGTQAATLKGVSLVTK